VNLLTSSADSAVLTGISVSSDRRLKQNIKPLETPLQKIMKLEGISFEWKKDGKASIGLIAQDVEKVYPELVEENEETGMKSVQYGNLVSPLIEAVKEQQGQIEKLEARIEQLESN